MNQTVKPDMAHSHDENWRILIVEDDERLTAQTKDYLEK